MRLSLPKYTFFTAFMLGILLPVLSYAQGVILLAERAGEVTFSLEGANVTFALGDVVPVGTEVTTGSDGSVTFVFSNSSTITVSRNSFLTLSYFHQSGPPNFRRSTSEEEEGTSETNIKLDYGGVLSSVRPLNLESGSSFTVETPVGSAGVRGTNFFMGYDPVTGQSTLIVFAGIVSANDNENPSQFIYPSQAVIFGGNQQDTGSPSSFIDLDSFINNAGPDIIEAIIRNKGQIDEENAALVDALREGATQPSSPFFQTFDEETRERLQQNLDNLVSNIIQTAINNNKITPDRVRELIEQANEDASTNTHSRPPIDEEIRRKQEELRQRQEELLRKQEEQRKRNEELLEQLEQRREQQENSRKEQKEEQERLLRERLEQERERRNNTPPPNDNDMFIPTTPPVS